MANMVGLSQKTQTKVSILRRLLILSGFGRTDTLACSCKKPFLRKSYLVNGKIAWERKYRLSTPFKKKSLQGRKPNCKSKQLILRYRLHNFFRVGILFLSVRISITRRDIVAIECKIGDENNFALQYIYSPLEVSRSHHYAKRFGFVGTRHDSVFIVDRTTTGSSRRSLSKPRS